MITTILIVGSIAGLLLIFVKRYRETRKLERVKAKAVKREKRSLRQHTNQGDGSLGWKKKSLDYKAIHTAFNKADLNYSKGQIDEAQRGFIEVLSLHPDHLEANTKLGLIYIEKGIPQKAEAIFRHLIELNPNNPSCYSNLGLAVYKQGHYEEAREAYARAISLDSRNIDIYIRLGYVYKKMDNVKQAVNAFSKAIEMDAKKFDLYFVAADLLVSIKAYREAIAYLKVLLEHQPYNQEAKDLIRDIKIMMGENPHTGKKTEIKKAEDPQQAMFE